MAIKYVDMSGMRAVPVRKQGVWISVKRLWIAVLAIFEPEEVEVDFKVRQGRVRYTYRKVRKLPFDKLTMSFDKLRITKL